MPRTVSKFSKCLYLSLVVLFARLGLAQTVENNPWTGQAQCQVNFQIAGYAHQEIQTWTITGPPMNPDYVYPATWSVVSKGMTQRAVGPQNVAAQWGSNVAPMNAPLRIGVRPSDNRLLIKTWHAQMVSRGSIQGARQVAAGASAPAQSTITSDAYEWQFPVIEDSPTATTVSGTGTIVIAGTYMPQSPAGSSAVANCTWQFTKGASLSTKSVPIAPLASTMKPAGGVASPGVVPPAPAPPTNSESSASAVNLPAESAASKQPVQPVQATSQPMSNTSALLKTPPAPTGFTANSLGGGAVQFKWQAVSGVQRYRLAGSGIAASGLYVAATSNNVTVQQVPPGTDQWQIASVGLNNSWDPKQVATTSLIIRYPPAHSPAWLSKANGAGNPAQTLAHYLSLCNQCLPGANFKDVMLGLGLRIDNIAVFPDLGPGCGSSPWCGASGSPWVDEQAARYTNITEFENSDRVTGCWTIGQPNGRIVCYTKTSDHGLQVIVRQTDYSWFLSFTGDPNAEVFDWVSYNPEQIDRTPSGQRFNSAYTLTNIVTLDSEGPKFAPHTCLACHGGQMTAHGVTGSTLLPLDPGLIKPRTFTIAGFDYYYDPNNVRKVNQAVMTLSPSAAVARYLTGLYGIDPRVTSSSGDANYVPASWTGEPSTYKTVVKPYCMMCHLATPSNLDFTVRGNFYGNKELVYTTVCQAHSMPHAEAPYNTLWSKDTGVVFVPGYLAGIMGHESCP